jgi:hypothetical protein
MWQTDFSGMSCRAAPRRELPRSEARSTIQSGSFFERVPSGGDAYLLSHIIHDWSEEHCLAILGNCRRAMNPDGRVLIIVLWKIKVPYTTFGKL